MTFLFRFAWNDIPSPVQFFLSQFWLKNCQICYKCLELICIGITQILRQLTDSVWFNVALDTLQVISEMIFPTNHLIGVKTQSYRPITWLVLVNKIKQQQNYNTNNLNNTYK